MPEPDGPAFEIAGERYAVPSIETITIAEERILFLYADTVLRHLAPAPPALEENERAVYTQEQLNRLDNPDFKRAWAMIAYRRAHPDADLSDVGAMIDGSNALQFELALLGVDDSPPETSSQKPLEQPTETSQLSRPTSSGGTSTKPSDEPPMTSHSAAQDENPASTGIIAWDPSSDRSGRIASAS